MHPRGVKFFTLAFIFVIVFFPTRAFGYDTRVAHPNIAMLAARLYNTQFPDKQLSDSDIAAIEAGAIDEDMPTRWYNHFYDPVYGRGIWFDDEKKTALSWVTDPFFQAGFSLGDNSWQRAQSDFQKGERALALRELGHTLHLITDMAVPAHTRDDIHPAGDSYEQYVKNNWTKIEPQLKYSFQNLNSLNSAMYLLAKNTNANFYSDDTIESKYYQTVSIGKFVRINSGGDNFLVATGVGKNYIYAADGFDWRPVNKRVRTDEILSSYSIRLIPQAIAYSAGLIDLFFKEVAQKQKFSLPFFRTNAAGLKDFVVGSAINLGEQAKDYLVQTSFGEPAQEIGEQVLRQLDIDMTAKARVARGETDPPPAESPQEPSLPIPPAIIEPVVTPSIPASVPTPSTTPTPTYYYGGGGGGGSPTNSSPVPTTENDSLTPTTTITTSSTDTPTSTPTSTPSDTPTTTPTSTPSSTTTPEVSTSTPETPTTTPTSTPISTSTPETPTSTPSSTPPIETPTTTPTSTPSPTTTPETPTSTPETPTTTPSSTPPTPTILEGEQTEMHRTLTMSDSPFIISGSHCYTVPVGKKLTIEAGVTIRIARGLCLAVNGELDAKGTEDAHITITQLNAGEYWGQVYLNAATATFNYTDISGGDTGGLFHWKRGLVFADNHSYLELNHSTVSDEHEMAGAAVGAWYSVVKVRDSVLSDTEISNNCGNNVCNHGIRAAGGSIYVDNTILRNVIYGIRGGIVGDSTPPIVYSSDFSTVTGQNIWDLYVPSPMVRTTTPV